MHCLIEPKGNVWVATNDARKDEKWIRDMVSCAGICISDLDDTDAKSPAKYLAEHQLFHSEQWNLEFLAWSLQTAWKIARGDPTRESEQWKQYVAQQLDTPRKRKAAAELFQPGTIEHMLYEDVCTFYDRIPPQARTTYVTRNIREIALRFAQVTFGESFDPENIIGETYDKAQTVLDLIGPGCGVIFKDDSPENGIIAHTLNFHRQHKIIPGALTIHVTKQPDEYDKRYDVSIGRNYRGLVDVIANG